MRGVAARLDLGTVQWQEVGEVGTSWRLRANDIARVQIETQAPLAFDPYSDARATGAFVLVDPGDAPHARGRHDPRDRWLKNQGVSSTSRRSSGNTRPILASR